MTKPTIALALAAAMAGGLWLGRSTQDEVRAEPPLSPAPVEVAPRRASVPMPRPALPTRAPARGLAADLVAADPKIRRAAVAELARDDQPDPQTLLAASRDPDPEVARAALAGVGTLYADGRIETKDMIALVKDRSIPERVRTAAFNGLGTVASPDAGALLAQLVATGSVLERRMSAALLGNQEPEIAVPALIAALRDDDEYVRSNALESLRLRSRGRDFGLDAGAWQAWWQSAR